MGYVARDVMSRDVITVSRDMDLRELEKLFLGRAITGAPVVDAEGNLSGVISQTDLLYYHLCRDDELVVPTDFYERVRVEGRHLPKGFQIADANTGTVADVMTPVVHSVVETTPIEVVARLMTQKHIHRVIVRKGRKPVGIISAIDVLRVVGKPAPKKRASWAARPPRPASGRRA